MAIHTSTGAAQATQDHHKTTPSSGTGTDTGDQSTPSPDSSSGLGHLAALCAIARFHQVAADPATLAHQLGLPEHSSVDTHDLLRAAQHLGLKARLVAA